MLRFIVQGSPDTAADTAYELQQYLQTEWQVEVEATSADKSVFGSADANSRSVGFDLDPAQIMLLFSGIKLAIDTAHELLETKKKLEDLSAWAETTFTRNHDYLWLEVNGIPYPVKADKLDDIIKAMQ